MRMTMFRIFRIMTIICLMMPIAYAQDALDAIDGNWYSTQWKYGYVLKNGIGTATSTNSPNFKVGQNILILSATSPTTFTGRQVYTDGKFYNVQATLQADGRLYFEGEKNVKWVMERVDSNRSTPANVVNTRFTLVNRSAEPIFKVFISPLQSTGWGQDILGEEVLMQGYEQNFNAGSSRGCSFDLRVEYQSRRVEEKRNLNLCQLERVDFDGRSATAPTSQANPRPAPSAPSAVAPRPAASYDGTSPLRCGTNVNCRIQSEVVQKMQMRWGAFSRSTHYGSACLRAIQTIRTMHPAAYGNGDPGFVQPQMDVCNLR